MLVNQKNLYARREIFELARNQGKGPIKVKEIGEVQAIFLFCQNLLTYWLGIDYQRV